MVTDSTSQSDDTTAFLRAARSGNLEKVIEYLDTNLDINTANSNGLNALHLASKDGHVEIVTELLKRGAKVDSATKKGNTALHIASLAGQADIVSILIQYGAAVNIQSQNGFTPLYMAAQENHDNVVKLLLSNGANQSLATEDGFTPLAVAMQQGHDKVVSVLLENDSKGKVRLPALHIAAKKDDCKAADLLLQNDHKPDVTSKSGFTPLHIAAHYGNEEIGRLLIKRGADVNYLAKHNISPLHVAAKWGKNNMVKLLLENSAQIDAKTRDGLTPLHCAARSGHEEVVSTLLEQSAPISARTKNGLAPLHMASQGDHVDAARVLLYHRAPVDEVTIDYLTSLHVAAHCGHVRVAKLLLDRKADPNARALNGFTPLHIACKKNRIKVVELLLKHGASIESTTESGLTPLHVASFMGCMNIVIFLLQHEANPDVPTVRGETPLHLAARANQTDIIRILLRNGAKVDARAREEQTPLHIASRLGNVDIVMLLLQHGAAVDTTTKDMYTALHIAAKEGQEEVAAILVENHASVKASTKNGFTPLHIAAKYGNMNVAKILLQKDSKLDSQGKNDITPLHLACHYDHPNVANMILEKGASPHLSSQNGHTPLHIAARKNQMDIASTLLECGADPNAQSKAGFTPLQLSAQKGHYDMTNLLIEHGADPNHRAKNGLTALHLCAQEDSIRVASILVKNGANVESETESGYRPIHVASHFGNLSMIRFLLKHNAQIDVRTNQNYTPMHQAAQQGHAHVVSALVEGNASHNARTTDGLTPLNIAQKLGYISVMEALKGLPQDTQTPDNKTWEEKYKVIAPESLQETSFMSDSEDEGGSDGLINEQPYRYLTADLMKSLRDDSLPIDVTRDDPVHLPISREEKQQFTQSSNYCPPENFDSTDGINLGFLVSFLVDARGGAMKGCRHSGIRIIVPPRRAPMPIRVTCRLIKPSKVANPPSLMEGEALATRIIEMGPVGATFLGPVLIDVPHFASVQGKEREIIILRSENGDTWKEHDNSHENDDTLFNTTHDTQMSAAHSGRITRIITTEFPQYFAIVTRIKQEVHVIGADGGILISSVANHVQAVFPPGALTKKIKVGLQAHVIPAELTAKLLGNCVAVSPVITIEPRRRKFHKPITLTIPVPQAANKGMINQYAGETPTLRLLCSIAGGTSEAQWEDVTGSTPLTFLNDRVSFTTTVSARFWLMDCRNISEVPKMATELYKESLFVPFVTNFVIYSKRFDVIEATLRILCMTDGKDGLHTLEKQEEFLEIVKSRDVEALDGKDLYLEFSGNLVPVTKSGQQLRLTFRAFRQNRLSFHVKVRDPLVDPVARMMFMRAPKVAKGEPAQQPICVLNIVLPEVSVPKSESHAKLKELESNIISKMDMYKTTYMRDYGEKRDIPKPTSPIEQKRITDILLKEQTDAETIHDSFAQKVACPLESVDASYPNNVSKDDDGSWSPELEKQTYSEKRRFWEDITKKRDSYQRSESELSRTSQLTVNESDSEYIQNMVSEEILDMAPQRSETMEDINVPDMSECSVAEKAHYFEEQIQREMSTSSRPTSKIIGQDSFKERRDSSFDQTSEQFDTKDAKQDRNTLEFEKIEKENILQAPEDIEPTEPKVSDELSGVSSTKPSSPAVSNVKEENKSPERVVKVSEKIQEVEKTILEDFVDLKPEKSAISEPKVQEEENKSSEKVIKVSEKILKVEKTISEDFGDPASKKSEISEPKVEQEENKSPEKVVKVSEKILKVEKTISKGIVDLKSEKLETPESKLKEIDVKEQQKSPESLVKGSEKIQEVEETMSEEFVDLKLEKSEIPELKVQEKDKKSPEKVVKVSEKILEVEKTISMASVDLKSEKMETPPSKLKEIDVNETKKSPESLVKVSEKILQVEKSILDAPVDVQLKKSEISESKLKEISVAESQVIVVDEIKPKSSKKLSETHETDVKQVEISREINLDKAASESHSIPSARVEVDEPKSKLEALEVIETKPSLIPRKIAVEDLARKFDTPVKAKEKSLPAPKEPSTVAEDAEGKTKQACTDLLASEAEFSSEEIQSLESTVKAPSKIPKPTKFESQSIQKGSLATKEKLPEVKHEIPPVDKDSGRKESKIPIPSTKIDKEKSVKVKDESPLSPKDIKTSEIRKIKSEIPKKVSEETRKITETTKITEKHLEHHHTRTSETKTHSSTFTTILTDPEEALKAFEDLEPLEDIDTSVKTSKIDHVSSTMIEKKEIKSSEISRGDEKILQQEENLQHVSEKSSESTTTTETPQETEQETESKQEKLDKTQNQQICVNLAGGKQTIDASASQAVKSTKDRKEIHSFEDDDGLVIHEAASKHLKTREIDAAIKLESNDAKSDINMSDLGMSLEDELKAAVIHEQNHEESSSHFDTKVFPSREASEDISQAPEMTPTDSEVRDIAETLVQSIEDEIIKRSESSSALKLGFEFSDESSDFDENLADDLTKKFENMINKRKPSQAQVIESIDQIRSSIFMQEEKDSTRGSLSFSEDLTKDEDSTPQDREESLASSSSHVKIVDRDCTMSPSSVSDLEEVPEGEKPDSTPKPIIEFPQELKVAQEYFEEPREVVAPMRFESCESSGARVLEILEPDYESRQDSIEASSLDNDEAQEDVEVDELSLNDGVRADPKFNVLHESTAVESLDKILQEHDFLTSPCSVSELSMMQERSLSPVKVVEVSRSDDFVDSEDGGFSSMEPERPELPRLDAKAVDKTLEPPITSPRLLPKELELKPVDWMIGEEKIEVSESLQPSQEFDRELDEYQTSIVKQLSLPSSQDGSGDLESATRSSEDVSAIDSVKEVIITAQPPSKFTITPAADIELELDASLVEDNLELSCQELVATLQREYEAKTPTDEQIPLTPRRISDSEGESEALEEPEEPARRGKSMSTEKEEAGDEEKDIDSQELAELKPTKVDIDLKSMKEAFSSKTKSFDEPRRHPEKLADKLTHAMSTDSSSFKLKSSDHPQNVDLSAQYAITMLGQVVTKEIAEVKESLEAAKQDLIEELSENSERVIQIKDSPSEFQFKLQPESIPNDLPFLYKAPSPEPAAVAPPQIPEAVEESEKSESEISARVTTEESSLPTPASRFKSDSDGREDSSSLSIPQAAPRRRQKPVRASKKIYSESEGGSSSGESSNYQSCDYDIGSGSRPSSSDVEALQSACGFPSATASEYETALMSIDQSSKRTSQEYHSAVSTLSSRESMKSLNSLSSGHLGSIDSTGDVTETLIASEPEMDKEEIDENLEAALDDDKPSDSSDSDIPLDESYDNICSGIPTKMKRSSEMIFQQISEDADSSLLPEEPEGGSTEDQSTKVTSSMLISDDDDLKTSTIDAISEQISAKVDSSSISPDMKVKLIEAQATGDDIDSSELRMPTTSLLDEAEALLLSKRSVLQQASMSTSSTSGVSIETVIEREKTDRHSPDSDSFELVDKPDIIDDFVVIEEVGREAEEFDSEGKSISIKPIAAVSIKKFDRDLENLITERKEESQATVTTQLSKNTDVFDFESEESPPQASNEDQYSQSYSDDEQDSKKWMEMQFQADGRPYELEYDRGPLEDIKEEEITDFEAGSSRFGSLGSQKGSIGSSGSMKGSYGAEYDVLAGRKMFSRSVEHDNISVNSLQEFETLEKTVAENARRLQCGSTDSVNNGSLPKRVLAGRSGHGDDISVSSLKDFEGLEKACKDAHIIELRAREEEDLLEHQSPENRYRLESLPRPKAAETSGAESFNPSTSGSDDYEKRIMEIDEIIRIAQANVEKFDRQDDTTEDISQIEITDIDRVESSVPPATSVPIDSEDLQRIREGNVMETSTDSLELEEAAGKNENLMCRSSDSLEMKTTVDFPSLSYSDSLNNVRDPAGGPCVEQFNTGRRISSDSLDMEHQRDAEERNVDAESSHCPGKSETMVKNGKTVVPATTDA